jgi:hypothetical protein
MKNYLILFATLLCAFMACKKVETPTDESKLPVFTKSFEVTDSQGNAAYLEVTGSVEEQINQMNSLQFEIFTTSEIPQDLPQTARPSTKNVAFADWNDENTLSINVTNFTLQKGITGFRVDLKPEFKKIPTNRNRWSEFYEFGAAGVHGAYAKYDSESCSQEELDIDLDKKQACSNWAYQDLASGYLTAVGDVFSSYTSASYCKYRFRFDFEDTCSASHSLTWYWLF